MRGVRRTPPPLKGKLKILVIFNDFGIYERGRQWNCVPPSGYERRNGDIRCFGKFKFMKCVFAQIEIVSLDSDQ